MKRLKVIWPTIGLNRKQHILEVIKEATYTRIDGPKTKRGKNIESRNNNQNHLTVRTSGNSGEGSKKNSKRDQIMVKARYALIGYGLKMLPRSIVFFNLGYILFLHNAEVWDGDPKAPPQQ